MSDGVETRTELVGDASSVGEAPGRSLGFTGPSLLIIEREP